MMIFGIFEQTGRRAWRPSRFSDLPSNLMMDDETLRDYGLLAGGLSLLLSRCSSKMLLGQFSSALQVHRGVTAALKRGVPVGVSPELLIQVSHDIAPYVDPATREAARRCTLRLRGLRPQA